MSSSALLQIVLVLAFLQIPWNNHPCRKVTLNNNFTYLLQQYCDNLVITDNNIFRSNFDIIFVINHYLNRRWGHGSKCATNTTDPQSLGQQFHPMLVKCWPIVYNAAPTAKQHCFNALAALYWGYISQRKFQESEILHHSVINMTMVHWELHVDPMLFKG